MVVNIQNNDMVCVFLRAKLLPNVPCFLITLVVCLFSIHSHSASNIDKTSLIDQGRYIYTQGIIESNIVHVGSDSSPAPATLFPCINCHGKYAQGKSEGGIDTPYLTVENIRKKDYQKSSTFNLSLMPRYNISLDERNALAAYIDTINEQPVTGVTDKQITLSVILPSRSNDNKSVSLSHPSATKAIFNAYAKRINNRGGIYQRKIHFDFIERDTNNIKNNSFITLDINATSESVPTDNKNNLIFSIFESTKKQKVNSQKHFSLYSRDYENITFYDQIAFYYKYNKIGDNDNCQKNQLSLEQEANFISHTGTSKELISRLTHLQRNACTPTLFIKQDIVTQSNDNFLLTLLKDYSSPIYLFSSPSPDMVNDRSQKAYFNLKHNSELKDQTLNTQELNIQLWALTLLYVIEDSLNASGRQLNQEKIITHISKLHQYQTGFGPALSFTGNNNIGAHGAFIKQLNTQQHSSPPHSSNRLNNRWMTYTHD